MLRKKEMLKHVLYTFTAKKKLWMGCNAMYNPGFAKILFKLSTQTYPKIVPLLLSSLALGTQHAQHGTLCSLQPRCKRRRQRLHSVHCKWRQTAWLAARHRPKPLPGTESTQAPQPQCFMGSLLQLQAELQVTHSISTEKPSPSSKLCPLTLQPELLNTQHTWDCFSVQLLIKANNFIFTGRNVTEQQCHIVLDVVLPAAVHPAAPDTAREEQTAQTWTQHHQWLSLVLPSGKYPKIFK